MTSKKILLCADSRILFPQVPGCAIENFTGIGRPGVEKGMDWSSKLHQLTGGVHEFTTHRTGIEHYMFSLFELDNILQNFPDKYFDLTLLQVGWLESICYWEEGLIKELLGDKFNKNCLYDPGLNSENSCIEYLYKDEDGEQKTFDLIHQKSKNCLGLGFHSIKVWCGLFNKRIKPMIEHHYDALRINNRHSSYSDYLHMPMDPWWVENYVGPDGIHYNRFDQNACDHIAGFVARYIKRIDKTINSILQEYNTDFYQEAVKIGKDIAAITNPKDVVLLSLTDTKQLSLLFIGCILYGRIPLLIQPPRNNLTSNNFDNYLTYIHKNASLCITEKQYQHIYEKHIRTMSDVPACTQYIELGNPEVNDIAFMQRSSGTTPVPDIIEITHKQIVSHCDEYATFIGLTSQDTTCSWMSLHHNTGLITNLLLPLLINAKNTNIDYPNLVHDPTTFIKTVAENKSTHIWMPNFAFRYLANRFPKQTLFNIDLSHVKQIISCAEPVYTSDLKEFYNTFADAKLKPETFRTCYTIVENVFAVSQSSEIRTTVHKNQQYVSCGRILPGTSVIIMKNGADVTTEGDNKFITTLPGEIIRQNDIEIGHVMIKSCYEPNTNERSDFFGYYDTGDLGFMENGYLYITGQQQNAFKSYGISIYPEHLEYEINKCTDIINKHVICFGVLHNGTNSIHICAETHEPHNQDIIQEITNHINELYDIKCQVHLRPHRYIIKYANGTMNREATKEKFLNEPVAQARGVTAFCSKENI